MNDERMAENTSTEGGAIIPKNGSPAREEKGPTDERQIVYLQGMRFAMLATLFVYPLSPHHFITPLVDAETGA